jgi:hypothetical protein
MSKFVSLAVFFLFAFELLVTTQAGPALAVDITEWGAVMRAWLTILRNGEKEILRALGPRAAPATSER